MADFEISTNSLLGTADQMSEIARKISRINDQARSVMSNTRGSLLDRLSASLKKNVVCGSIGNCSNDLRNLSKGAKDVAIIYRKYEDNIKNKKTTNPNELHNPLDDLFSLLPILPSISLLNLISPAIILPNRIPGKSLIESLIKDTKFSPNYADKDLFYEHKQKQKKWYEKNSDAKKAEKIGTILEWKKELPAEATYYRLKKEGKSKYAQGEFDVKIGSAEANCEAHAGMYVYEKDKDGNLVKKLAPEFGFSTGASVTAASVKGSGRVGFGENNNMLGLVGDGEVTVGQAKVGVKGSVSLFSDNPEAYVKADAEAVLVEAKGSAGVSVLGTDVKVTGGVKVGVGAHAEVGYVDGKVKVDIGASLGVGVDLGFEVDIGGTVDAISSGVKSLWNKFF